MRSALLQSHGSCVVDTAARILSEVLPHLAVDQRRHSRFSVVNTAAWTGRAVAADSAVDDSHGPLVVDSPARSPAVSTVNSHVSAGDLGTPEHQVSGTRHLENAEKSSAVASDRRTVAVDDYYDRGNRRQAAAGAAVARSQGVGAVSNFRGVQVDDRVCRCFGHHANELPDVSALDIEDSHAKSGSNSW